MRTALALLAAGLALGGCVTKPIAVDCDPFRTRYVKPVPRSLTMEEIQSGVGPAAKTTQEAREELVESLRQTLGTAFISNAEDAPAMLALSGGGQWGAFGSAYLKQLASEGGPGLPRYDTITGVSTGALQALYIGWAQAPGANSAKILDALTTQYNPASEREIVHRSSKYLAPFKGSVARLGPLRKRIEDALCDGGKADLTKPGACPLIEGLAAPGAPTVLLGFVEARTGEMQYVNVTKIAQDAVNPLQESERITMKTAQQCITGGALASVAMPFFYQQVQVNSAKPPKSNDEVRSVTYLDGGVRQSMFLVETATALSSLAETSRARLAKAASGDGQPTPAPPSPPSLLLDLVRNGPTIAKLDGKADGSRDAISSALRGYSLIVNQSEVSAIETIRLRYREASVRLVTADGYDTIIPPDQTKACKKADEEAMFEPDFMQCLQAYGTHKAKDMDNNGWIILTKP
jgi:predicted acylesterase/phospholipase RssA